MNLGQLGKGEEGIVTANTHDAPMKRRIQDLGILRGAIITCVGVSPFGDPVAYKIRNTVIALRIKDAEKIYINEVEYD